VGFGAPMGVLPCSSAERATLSGPEARPAHPSEPIQVAENRVAGGITAGAHTAHNFSGIDTKQLVACAKHQNV